MIYDRLEESADKDIRNHVTGKVEVITQGCTGTLIFFPTPFGGSKYISLNFKTSSQALHTSKAYIFIAFMSSLKLTLPESNKKQAKNSKKRLKRV